MTDDERECRFEWIEAAIRWHQQQVAVHRDAEADLNRMHTQLCRIPRRRASAVAAEGPALLASGRFLPDLTGAVMAPVIFMDDEPWRNGRRVREDYYEDT